MMKSEDYRFNRSLIAKLPSAVSSMFNDCNDHKLSLPSTHRRIWLTYFSIVKPSYEEIMTCFSICKPKDINNPTEYPFRVAVTRFLSFPVPTENYFIEKLIKHSKHTDFWNKCSLNFLRKYQKVFIHYLNWNNNLIKDPEVLINAYASTYNWTIIEELLNRTGAKKLAAKPRRIIEKNLGLIFAKKMTYTVQSTAHSFVAKRQSGTLLFELIAKGVIVERSFFNRIFQDETCLLDATEFKQYLIEDFDDHTFNNRIYKYANNQLERELIRKFVLRVKQNAKLNLLIRMIQ